MPQVFLKPETIAAVALERLRREIVLPRLVTPMGLADFRGAKDDTVNVRVPAILNAREYEWRTRTQPIVVDVIEELSIPVALDKHVYSAVQVTDEELTLDIVSFTAQVLEPQVIAVAEKLEALIADSIEGATFAAADIDYVEDANGEGAPFYKALVEARKTLNNAKVPLNNRFVLVGANVEAAALKEDAFRKVDESGSTDALRRASLGTVAGFSIFTSLAIDPDFAVAAHRSAFAFANVGPAVPAGVAFGSSQSEAGLSMRWIRDYDAQYLRDRSVLSSFAGAASVNDGRDPASPGGTPGDLNDTNIRAVKIAYTPLGS